MTELIASSTCPICGVGTPHTHTVCSLIFMGREKILRDKFKDYIFSQLDPIPGSRRMKIFIFRRDDSSGEYIFWPIKMLWRCWKRASEDTIPYPEWIHGYPGKRIPAMWEAIGIINNPFNVKLPDIWKEEKE